MEVSIAPKLHKPGEQPDSIKATQASVAPPPPYTTLAAEKELVARQIDAQRQADGIPNLLRR